MAHVRRLLLISNSTLYGSGYLDHAEAELRSFLGERARVVFVPHAVHDHDRYAAQARARFAAMGYPLMSVTEGASLDHADAVFIGGGNTFRLLDGLHRHGLLGPIRARVASGMPYIGSSAGSIVACPTLKTTKDMPVIQPPSFDALGLVPFQISPHYLDPDPASTHMGETQEERILQYLEENDLRVVGLREGAMLRVEGDTVLLTGRTAARIFTKGRPPVESLPGERLDYLLA
jgi:dipeptidase E